jgi:hypothetical protein
MTGQSNVKWSFDADYLQACNCDYGCPCEFEAPPTYGFCEGMGAWKINCGNFGDVPLDGLGLGFAINFPGPMHKGNGIGVFYIDEAANPQQRDALLEITSGRHGYALFEILAMILAKKLEPQFVHFDFKLDGKFSSVRVGDKMSVRMEPIKNPVSGEPEEVRIEHGTGFLFKSAEVVSAEECSMVLSDWSFSHPKKAGFVSKVHYGN